MANLPRVSPIDSAQPEADVPNDTPQQTRRILWVIPNYRAVSTSALLPRLSLKEKFWLATQDSFDYSSFIFTGILAGIAMANVSEPRSGRPRPGTGSITRTHLPTAPSKTT